MCLLSQSRIPIMRWFCPPAYRRDLGAAVETLLSLGGKERVKHLVLGHPDLLMMGFELPGRSV